MKRTPLKTKHSCALSVANKLFFFAAMLVSIATVAQPRTFVKSVSVDYATKQVTFNLSWAAGSRGAYNGKVYYSKVWVWVDYQTVTDPNSKGAWQRATVDLSALPANCTADGTNAKGFWYQGQATAAQNANITVTLTNMPAKFNWCAYASDCPPRIVGNSGGTYTFAGTPPFILTAVNGATQEVAEKTIAASSLTIAPVKITDKTGYPGVWCPYTGSDLFVDATHACIMRTSGANNWEAWIKDAIDSQLYRVTQFTDGTWWFATDLNVNEWVVQTHSNGVKLYSGNNKPSCPSGWNLPTSTQLRQRYSTVTGTFLGNPLVHTDFYGGNLTTCDAWWVNNGCGSNIAQNKWRGQVMIRLLTIDCINTHHTPPTWYMDCPQSTCNLWSGMAVPVRCVRD